ncbi:putative IMP cyclohydrolase, partial [human gut metagenome]
MTTPSVPTTAQAVPTKPVPTEGLINPEQVPVHRALISVYDKTGLTELASALVEA